MKPGKIKGKAVPVRNLVSYMKNICFVIMIFAVSCSSKQDYTSWIGNYQYEEEPVKALSGYSMSMIWDIEVRKHKSDYNAKIEVNGQQTFMVLQAKITGDSHRIKFLFDKGLDGNGFEDFKRGDNLFELTKKNGKLLTKWGKLSPQLLETFKNDTICFKLIK